MAHINTGLCIIASHLVDLNLVEKWLSKPGFPMSCHFAEQTLIAALVSYGNVEFLPENEYNIARLAEETSCSFIHYCGHYLSGTRIAMRKIGQQIVLKQLCQSTGNANHTLI